MLHSINEENWSHLQFVFRQLGSNFIFLFFWGGGGGRNVIYIVSWRSALHV